MHRNRQSTVQSFEALNEFEERIPGFTLQAEADPVSKYANPTFIRTGQLRAWLDETRTENEAQVKNIERLLGDAFSRHHGNRTWVPYDFNKILRTYPRVFCMLLEVNKGHLIDGVMRQQITDDNICSLHEKHLEDKLKNVLGPNEARQLPELLTLFTQRRWAYCPHTFELDSDIELAGTYILPILQRQRINSRKWATASIHRLCIPEEFLGEKMRRRLAGTSFKLNEEIGNCYYIAVKTFTETGDPNDLARKLFDKECGAYKQLRDQKGMVQYLGAYTHRNAENRAEHNILLEYGDYDLAESFMYNPPVSAGNVCKFWYNLFSVASALSNLHRFGRPRRGQQEIYTGWHADIKPDNILSVKGVLKLADPGFAGFAKLVDGQDAARTSVTAMTSTYGSPECATRSRECEDPQASDMWSLGCVFSEAATWLILGPPGLSQYTKLRQNAVKNANIKRKLQRSDADSIGDGDYFHDGYSVLPEIKLWHDYLRENLRKSDLIAADILKIIDEDLLQTKPKARSSADEFCEKLESIKQRHPLEQQPRLPHAISNAVTVIEEQLKSRPKDPIWGQDISIQNRKALKSRGLLELPSEDFARISDTYKERLEAAAANSLPTIVTPSRHTGRNSDFGLSASPIGVSPIDPPESVEPTSTSPRQSLVTAHKDSRHTDNHIKHEAQSIFDAHYAKEPEMTKKTEKKSFKKWLSRKQVEPPKTKDELLERNFENRDIKFIIDNSASIIPEWRKVRFVLEKLAKKASYVDTDGMDLEFTNGGGELKIHESTLAQQIEEAMEKFKPRADTETNMKPKLGLLLRNWLHKFRQEKGSARAMTLIILTDGCWRGMRDTDEVENLIVKFNKDLKEVCGADYLERFFSIQFVSFGDDPAALYRLRHLDNDLGIDDIVDTEPWTGDVYKMLLGSHNFSFDSLDPPDQDEELEHNDGASYILPRRDTETSARQSGQFQTMTRHRRERSDAYPELSQTSTLPIPRKETHPALQHHPASAPQAGGQFAPRLQTPRRKPVQKDEYNYYRDAA